MGKWMDGVVICILQAPTNHEAVVERSPGEVCFVVYEKYTNMHTKYITYINAYVRTSSMIMIVSTKLRFGPQTRLGFISNTCIEGSLRKLCTVHGIT